jgi:hypothetical protein
MHLELFVPSLPPVSRFMHSVPATPTSLATHTISSAPNSGLVRTRTPQVMAPSSQSPLRMSIEHGTGAGAGQCQRVPRCSWLAGGPPGYFVSRQRRAFPTHSIDLSVLVAAAEVIVLFDPCPLSSESLARGRSSLPTVTRTRTSTYSSLSYLSTLFDVDKYGSDVYHSTEKLAGISRTTGWC